MPNYRVATPELKMIRRRDECFCGSRLKFKDCCGNLAPERKVPDGIHVFRNALSAGECRQLLADIESQERAPHDINPPGELADEATSSWVEKIVDIVDLGARQSQADSLFKQVCDQVIEPGQGRTFSYLEQPALLRFSEGGGYGTHADSELFNPNTRFWERNSCRDLSIYVYLNDDYRGGKLKFPHFGYEFKGNAGDVIAFPPDHRFMYSVEIVEEGVAYLLASWATWQLVGEPHLAIK